MVEEGGRARLPWYLWPRLVFLSVNGQKIDLQKNKRDIRCSWQTRGRISVVCGGSGGEWELVDREDALPLWKSLPLLNMTDSFLPFSPSSPYSLALSICLLPPCLSQKLFAVLWFLLLKVITKVIPLTDFINCTFLWKNKFNALCSLLPLTQNEVHKYLRNSIKTTQVNTTEHENEDEKKKNEE